MCLNERVLSKGPEERADGDHDLNLRGRERGGTHTTGDHRGGRGGGLAVLHHVCMYCV